MEYGTFTAQTVGEAVALVNLFIDPADEPDAAAVHDVLRLHDLHDDPLDLDAFAQLADDIGWVFRSEEGRQRTDRLNGLLAVFEPAPFLTEHDGQAPHFHYVPDDGPDVRRVGASLTMAVAHALVDHGQDRLGCCDAPGCRRVFVDHTRNGNQRFCSKTCATRVHVARHRARK